MSARSEILAKVRSALSEVSSTPTPVIAPEGARPADLIERFTERVADYRADVERCSTDELRRVIAAAVPHGHRVVVPPGLPPTIADAVTDAVVDDGLTPTQLDSLEVVLTCCRVAIAETGTLVLDHQADQGRRVSTLVPDRHICVVRAGQIVADVPQAMAALDPSRPLTWISGPSATSDIELQRVEGVHGPRRLHVIVVDDG